MADRVATNILVDQERRKVIQFTSVSDGTGETAVVKVSKAALRLPHDAPIKINKIWGMANGMYVNMFFDASNDDLIATIPDGTPLEQCYKDFGGLKDPQSTGNTGDIVFTTVGHTSGDTYSIILDISW